jgi:hypothetical protein
MLDANISLYPLTPIALDLGRTDGLSTQTPIDESIEFVVVGERPCGHSFPAAVVVLVDVDASGALAGSDRRHAIFVDFEHTMKSSMLLRVFILPLRKTHSCGACRHGPCDAAWL